MIKMKREAWAVCRVPDSEDPVLCIQKEGAVEEFTSLGPLNGREGFVMAPFHTHGSHPVLLIRPDLRLCGWKAIETSPEFSSLCFAHSLEGYPWQEFDTEEIYCTDSTEERSEYSNAFHRFMQALSDDSFHKLVLSRKQDLALPSGFSPWKVFREACRRYPRMWVYACYTPSSGLWMGCSPEILLSGTQNQGWHTVALAGTLSLENGTVPRSWDAKNSLEQEFVAQYLRTSLQAIATIQKEVGPYAVQAGDLAHLKTDFFFGLPSAQYLGAVLEALHPTPAVCGLPKGDALRFILAHEPHDRKYYSGVTGWISPTTSTALYVNLRCMEVTSSRRARLYAGGGILPQSECIPEWNETARKMQTMKSLIVPFDSSFPG